MRKQRKISKGNPPIIFAKIICDSYFDSNPLHKDRLRNPTFHRIQTNTQSLRNLLNRGDLLTFTVLEIRRTYQFRNQNSHILRQNFIAHQNFLSRERTIHPYTTILDKHSPSLKPLQALTSPHFSKQQYPLP